MSTTTVTTPRDPSKVANELLVELQTMDFELEAAKLTLEPIPPLLALSTARAAVTKVLLTEDLVVST